MNLKIYSLFILSLFFCSNFGFAQNNLTTTQAVQIAIENNYDIKVAQNNIAIAENNTDKRNNGYLPTISGSAGTNASLGGSGQKFANGNEASNSNAFSWGGNASIGANYTLYDETRTVTLNQLKEILGLSNLQLRQTVELNLMQVYAGYFEVARLTANLAVQEQTKTVSRQRLKRAQYRFDYGQGIRLDVLNAEVDIQRDSVNYLSTRQQLANAKRNLNVLMGRSVNLAFEVDTTVAYDDNLELSKLIQESKINNVNILLVEKNRVLSEYDLQSIDAQRKPTIGANASYNFNFSDNQPSSPFAPTFSNNRGVGVGLNLNWNIFDGGRRKIQEQNVQIDMQSLAIQKEQLLQQIERDIRNAWENYQTALYILEAEKANLTTNQLNLQRTEEQFRVGQINSVEFRQAQLNLLTAATSYNNAKFDAKVIEYQLLQLSGGLL